MAFLGREFRFADLRFLVFDYFDRKIVYNWIFGLLKFLNSNKFLLDYENSLGKTQFSDITYIHARFDSKIYQLHESQIPKKSRKHLFKPSN